MKQLNLKENFKPKNYRYINEDNKKSILETHLFLKEKRYGTIKSRTTEGGNKKMNFITKEYYSLPTI